MTNKSTLPNTIKAVLVGSGLIPKLKGIVCTDPQNDATHDLELKAYSMADNLQKLLDSGKLDDSDTQRITSLLIRLRGAMQGGTISKEALAMALSEAATAITTSSGLSQKTLLQQKTNQVWSEIEKHNQVIDDDFEKMRKAGIVFDEKLWKQHKELSEYLQAHPQDVEKQKELNAVDDQLLGQAEPQLTKVPGAKSHHAHATKESKERHQKVDKDLVEIRKSLDTVDSRTDLDWADVPTHKDSPSTTASGKQNNSEKLVRKQTNLCLRTKCAQMHGFFTLLSKNNPFTIKVLLGNLCFIATRSAKKSVQR